MLLASAFDDRGGWTVEQQFVLQMGSSYLMAHGIGQPLGKDATTKFTVKKAGDYTLWVRTKNWTAFWSDGKTPGIFQVKIDGKADPSEFGVGKANAAVETVTGVAEGKEAACKEQGGCRKAKKAGWY